jgi:hypothetical protein
VWKETNTATSEGIQDKAVSLDAADEGAALYTVLSNTLDSFIVETADDLSAIAGQGLVGVHTLNTLQVLGGAKVDFGDDRVVLLDVANSFVDADSTLTASDINYP